MFDRKFNCGASFILLFLFILPLVVFAGGGKEEKEKPLDTSSGTEIESKREALGSVADEAAAIVNGVIIPIKTYNNQVQAIVQQYTSQGANLQGEQLADVRMEVLDSLIGQELLYQDAVSSKLTLTDEAITLKLEEVKAQFPDEATYQSALVAQELTEENVRSDIGRTLLIEKYVIDKFSSSIEIKDSDITGFYENNGQYFSKPEQVRASHILIEVKPDAEKSIKDAALDKINDIKQRLNNGEEFSELARTFSEGPSNVNGGDLGFFGRGQMVKPFEDTVFSMKIGDISDVVETQFGYHLIRLTSKNASSTVSFEEVKGQIDEHLTQLKMAEMIDEYISTIKPDATIEVLIK